MGNKSKMKSMAKQAKERLKNGFWTEYRENVESTENNSDPMKSEILNYYRAKAIRELEGRDDGLYNKVKYILDNYGDVSDMIGRLCDTEYMKTLNFEQRERYLFELSDRYLECRERYAEEKRLEELLEARKNKIG